MFMRPASGSLQLFQSMGKTDLLMTLKIEALTRFPIKGLSGHTLDSVKLDAGQGFPCDR